MDPMTRVPTTMLPTPEMMDMFGDMSLTFLPPYKGEFPGDGSLPIGSHWHLVGPQ